MYSLKHFRRLARADRNAVSVYDLLFEEHTSTMDLPYAYMYFVRHIIPGPQSLSYLVPHILLPIALLTPRSVLSRWQNIAVFIPIMVGCTIHAWTVMGSVDVPSLNGLFWAAFLLVLHDPWTKFALLKLDVESNGEIVQDDKTSQNGHGKEKKINPTHTAVPYPSTLKTRIPWTFKLMSGLTLDNWLISYPPHDKTQPSSPQPKTRTSFILTTTLHACTAYLILDLTCALTTTDPYFTNPSIPLSSPLPLTTPPFLQTIPPRILRPTLIALQAYALIANLLPSPALLPSLLNAAGLVPDSWSPHSWPPYFGPPGSFLERGLSGWWGTFWHQTMRWSVSGPGIVVADYLGLARKGLIRRAIVLCSAFGLSGCVHMGLVPPEPLHLGAGVSVGFVRTLVGGFFWAQIVGMLLEDVVRRCVERVVSRETRRTKAWWWLSAVGNVLWLYAWFCCCMPLLGEAGRQLGWWRHWLVPVSFVQGLRGEGWIAWEYLRR
jgi:hypothetical protein